MTIVDIHTHVYPPAYMDLLRSRDTVPYVRTFPPSTEERLIILPGEDSSNSSTARGRPIGPEYYDFSYKIAFMDQHKIDISVVSLANPWLDFLPPSEAAETAMLINDDMDASCGLYPGRLYAFGTLPLSASVEEITEEIRRLKGMPWIRGVVMGTSGLGNGLDDERLNPVYEALEETGQTMFLHPHYGLPTEVYGPRASEYGHVLPLALGFPLETTIAVARLILSGVFDKYPGLTLLLAHSGGTLPFLAGRLESVIAHDAHLKDTNTAPKRSIWDVLSKNLILDAVVYSSVGLKAAVDVAGADRVLFGTDHPFFPPLEGEEDQPWLSVTTNYKAINDSFGLERGIAEGVLGDNAVRLLNLGFGRQSTGCGLEKI
ncbi:2-amino-3-carboxymuconate-6-semialdehyde decarboxylase [Morchella conica CCBAS932]|uniref:2-amino-3-carboxymuconate-6-semialdehyde decarboxylase n=1 Tax=Morchella conica CCBAS932 TaxID=1392247 RepID=A0A3N4L2K6_9PEZI|nr:2-amino-3-carboxymuconate-6-semialdehyde decarboxylase [Morchella conica CCBAS932]